MCTLLSSATVTFLISFTLSHTHTYAYTNYIQFPFVMLPRRLQTKWRRIRARIFLGFYLKWSSLNILYHIYSALSLIWSEGISFVRAATNDDTNGKYKHVEPDKLIFIIVSIAFNLFVVIRCILEKLLQVVALRIIEMFSRLPESTQLSCSQFGCQGGNRESIGAMKHFRPEYRLDSCSWLGTFSVFIQYP